MECTLCLGLSTYFTLHKLTLHAKQRNMAVITLPKRAATPAPISVSYPIRLKIPKLSIDAAFDYVALTHGALEAPKGPSNAGWYDRGPRPGEKGSSVIDGHFGWKDGIPAVFDNLHRLQKGDNIYVEDDRGATTTFVVYNLRTYNENESVQDVFHSGDGKAHLNLITCQGTWNEAHKSYVNRLVVFADKAM